MVVIHLERNLVEVGGVHVDGDIHVVINVVARRIVAFLFAFGIFAHDFGAGFAYFRIAAGDLGKVNNIGVCVAPTRCARDNEAARIFIDDYLGVAAQRACCVKCRHALFVGLAIIKLLANLFNGAAPAIAKERRKL